ncbi:hypothetical protein [Streptomyces sp. NBC_01187]|uniref:hypothetical protein n=1 Tax=Streptomyces sp. NBC_01187 TaxID=2903766 RepID=UPI002F9086CD|nr:hypothetical protein OG220_42095 [Streptomyces sp. NBC_01187]
MRRRTLLTATATAAPAALLAGLDEALADTPAPPRAGPLDDRLAAARALYDQGAHARSLDALPGLIADGHAAAASRRDLDQARLSTIYTLASAVLIKTGSYDRARHTADRARTWAEVSGSPLAAAAAAREWAIHLGMPDLSRVAGAHDQPDPREAHRAGTDHRAPELRVELDEMMWTFTRRTAEWSRLHRVRHGILQQDIGRQLTGDTLTSTLSQRALTQEQHALEHLSEQMEWRSRPCIYAAPLTGTQRLAGAGRTRQARRGLSAPCSLPTPRGLGEPAQL